MKSLLLVTFVILLAFTACAPSPEVVATAMAQTQAALPGETPQATLTPTPEPPTGTPTEILTPTSIATSTPDLRVIGGLPEDFRCTEGDLPVEGSYSLQTPQTDFDTSPFTYLCDHCTNKVLTGNLVPKYISQTKRLDGWLSSFKKANESYPGFDSLGCYVQQFRTIEGAQLAVREYAFKILLPQARFAPSGDPGPNIGDTSISISSYLGGGHQADGIEFSYKNYAVTIAGLNGTQNLDDIYFVAHQILKKLEDAQLSTP